MSSNMTLQKMVNFCPTDEEMAMLPLDVIVYLKMSIISLSKEDNYDFIRFLFAEEDINSQFYKLQETTIYDFDGTNTNQEKFVTIVELFSVKNYFEISDYLKEILEKYTHEADVIIDFFTHDNKKYRLSNLDGIVKLEELVTNV